MANDTIINSLLCFLNTATRDYSTDSLSDLIYSFYSLEKIKESKTILYDILSLEQKSRNDPGKKRKEVTDVINAFNELKEKKDRKYKYKFLCDTYNDMPPVGLEFIAPILVNLSEEVARINELLPKIMDMKTEVVSTADSTRDLKIEMSRLKSEINNSFKSLSQNIKDNSPKSHITPSKNQNNCLSTDNKEICSKTLLNSNVNLLQNRKEADSKATNLIHDSYRDAFTNGDSNTTRNLGPQITPHVMRNRNSSTVSPSPRGSFVATTVSAFNASINRDSDNRLQPTNSVLNNEENGTNANENNWNKVDNRKKSKDIKPNNSINTHRLTGAKKIDNGVFKAVKRSIDVYIGRVHPSVTTDDVKKYIMENFKVEVLEISQLEIRTTSHNSFRVRIYLDDRDTLFKAETWPENMVISKFYSKKPRNQSNI